jgi:hypothetical protein
MAIPSASSEPALGAANGAGSAPAPRVTDCPAASIGGISQRMNESRTTRQASRAMAILAMPEHGQDPDRSGRVARGTFLCRPRVGATMSLRRNL